LAFVRRRDEIENIAANVTAKTVDGERSIGSASHGATRGALTVPGAWNEQSPCLRPGRFVEPKAMANVARINQKTAQFSGSV
jgi:hypothetical protein